MGNNKPGFSLHFALWLLLVVNVSHAREVSIAVFEEHDKYVKSARAYGISWSILAKAALEQNIVLDPQPGSWQGGMNRLRAGKVDLVFYAIRSEQRETWAVFSLPFVTAGSAIFTHHHNPVSTIEEIDFVNASVGVSADSVQEVFAKEAGFQNIYSTVERNQLYKMLSLKRLDYLFFAIDVIDYYCTYFDPSMRLDCLKQVGAPYDQKTVHVMGKSSPAMKELMDRINQGIVNVSQSVDTMDIFKQYGIDGSRFDSWKQTLPATKR